MFSYTQQLYDLKFGVHWDILNLAILLLAIVLISVPWFCFMVIQKTRTLKLKKRTAIARCIAWWPVALLILEFFTVGSLGYICCASLLAPNLLLTALLCSIADKRNALQNKAPKGCTALVFILYFFPILIVPMLIVFFCFNIHLMIILFVCAGGFLLQLILSVILFCCLSHSVKKHLKVVEDPSALHKQSIEPADNA